MFGFNKFLIEENQRLRDRVTFLETRQDEMVELIIYLRKPERMTKQEAKGDAVKQKSSPEDVGSRPSDAYSAAMKRAEARIDEAREINVSA